MDQCTFVVSRQRGVLDWCDKHVLCLVGVQLLKFSLLPYIPIVSLKEDPSCQFSWEHVIGHCLMYDRFVIVRVVQLIVIAVAHTVQVMSYSLELIEMHLRDTTSCVEIAIFLMGDSDSTIRQFSISCLL